MDRAIAGFARNGVAANLLMGALLVGGALVFLLPVDSGVLFGTGVGADGVLLLFSEGYMSREQKPGDGSR